MASSAGHTSAYEITVKLGNSSRVHQNYTTDYIQRQYQQVPAEDTGDNSTSDANCLSCKSRLPFHAKEGNDPVSYQASRNPSGHLPLQEKCFYQNDHDAKLRTATSSGPGEILGSHTVKNKEKTKIISDNSSAKITPKSEQPYPKSIVSNITLLQSLSTMSFLTQSLHLPHLTKITYHIPWENLEINFP